MDTNSTCNDVCVADFQTERIIAGYFLVSTMARCGIAPACGERTSNPLYLHNGLLDRLVHNIIEIGELVEFIISGLDILESQISHLSGAKALDAIRRHH